PERRRQRVVMSLGDRRKRPQLRAAGPYRRELPDIGSPPVRLPGQPLRHQVTDERGEGALLAKGALPECPVGVLVELYERAPHGYITPSSRRTRSHLPRVAPHAGAAAIAGATRGARSGSANRTAAAATAVAMPNSHAYVPRWS